MLIKECVDRNEDIIKELVDIWEESVRATHHFLSEENIKSFYNPVKKYLAKIENLLIVEVDNEIAGFMGVNKECVDMLFLKPQYFSKGIGTKLLNTAIDKYNARYIDVNEQNTNARRLYEYIGFVVYKRSEVDGQGNPFPILHMKIDK